ncbi:MAG: hypothetical protein ACI4JF_09015 [Oscillospiraceae bacterium]
MASNFEQHIDTEKLNQIAVQLRGLKESMDNKVSEIGATINKLESDTAYQSAESAKIKETFNKFKNTVQAEFDKDMEAFAVFMEKVSTQHIELATTISANIDTQLEGQTQAVASKFNS